MGIHWKVSLLHNAANPDVYAEGCYQSGNHDTADLCAQWRAALAAEEAARAATLSNYIGAAGALLSFASIVLVLVALSQTRKANRIAEQSAERQLRAYVLPKTVTIAGMTEMRPIVTTVLENSGQTPAYNLKAWIQTRIMVIGTGDFKHTSDPHGPMTIAPGGTTMHDNILKTNVVNDHRDGLISGEKQLFLSGYIIYVDCFKVERKCKFRYRLLVRKELRDAPMILCPEGNESD